MASSPAPVMLGRVRVVGSEQEDDGSSGVIRYRWRETSGLAGAVHFKRVNVEATSGGKYTNFSFLRGKRAKKVAMRYLAKEEK